MTSYVRHALSVLATLAMVCGSHTRRRSSRPGGRCRRSHRKPKPPSRLGETSTCPGRALTPSLCRSGAWSGDKTPANSSETITPVATRHLHLQLLATDENGREATDSVTVDVVNGPITPAPVTFDGCEVIVPATPNVTYFVDYGDEDIEELEADTYPADYFDSETLSCSTPKRPTASRSLTMPSPNGNTPHPRNASAARTWSPRRRRATRSPSRTSPIPS